MRPPRGRADWVTLSLHGADGFLPTGGTTLHNGQPTAEIQEEVPLTTLGNKRMSSGDKIPFPRSSLHPITTLGKYLPVVRKDAPCRTLSTALF